MKRRDFLTGMAATALIPSGYSAGCAVKSEYHAFSRVLQFLKDPYKAAALLRSCGYDAVEWTARPNGFIDTGSSSVDMAGALKRAKAAADSEGLKAESLIVGFIRGDDSGAEKLIMQAAEVGFKSFRGGYLKYDRSKTHRQNLDYFKRSFDTLEALARKSKLKCCYQNHSTYNRKVPLFGSLVWDLSSILPAYDPKYIGVQYDPMHIRAEAGPSWDHALGAIAPWVDMVCLKDFHFALDNTGRDWKRVLVPAGKGIVDFREVKRLMELEGVKMRFSIHYDYNFPQNIDQARCCLTDDLNCFRSIFG